jgi:hypothetical protein
MLALLDGDRAFFDTLVERGIIQETGAGIPLEDAENARIARVLVQELEVNWAGVEIILRMRAQMQAIERQVGELVAIMTRRKR